MFLYLITSILLMGSQDEKKIDNKDDEKIVGSYLLFKYVNSDSLLLQSTR